MTAALVSRQSLKSTCLLYLTSVDGCSISVSPSLKLVCLLHLTSVDGCSIGVSPSLKPVCLLHLSVLMAAALVSHLVADLCVISTLSIDAFTNGITQTTNRHNCCN